MRPLDPDIKAHLALTTTFLCVCVRIERVDGEIFAFTDHDQPVTVDGITYVAVRGVAMSAITTSSGLNVDTLEINGFLGAVSEVSIKAGVWDAARVFVFEACWAAPDSGINRLKRGIVGEVRYEVGTQRLFIEVRGISQLLQAAIGETCSPVCKADLYDARCKVVPIEGTWKFSNVVATKFISRREIEFAAVGSKPNYFFSNGSIECTFGNNEGIKREISGHVVQGSNAYVVLFEALPYDVAEGFDKFTLLAGCMKRFSEDCISKFSNKLNFRGFPHLPGPDSALEGP
jgi:uncharacterized phage protein (TIGR02218 family)